MLISKNSRKYISIRLYCLTLFSFLIVCVFFEKSFADVDFSKLYGSDTGMGTGARAAAMGGAFVGLADDPSSVYWNPAGLTDINRFQLYFSLETPAEFSSASVVIPPFFSLFQTINVRYRIS